MKKITNYLQAIASNLIDGIKLQFQSRLKGKSIQHFLAFSLIELMISLIAISSITAAFTPVISKKIKNGTMSVGGSVFASKEACKTRFPDNIDSNDCLLCKDKVCLICTKNCGSGNYTISKSCGCGSCSTKFSDKCSECNEDKCTKAISGWVLKPDGTFAKCPDHCASCSATNGKCVSAEVGYAIKSDGTIENCGAGYYCPGGTNPKRPCSQVFGEGCTKCSNTESKCTEVSSGYIIVNNMSKKCSDKWSGCIGCDSSTNKCTKVEPGYYIKSDGSTDKCTQTQYCKGGNNGVAVNCSDSSDLNQNTSNKGCNKCQSFPAACLSVNIGYYINKDKKAEKCSNAYYCAGGTQSPIPCSTWKKGCATCSVNASNVYVCNSWQTSFLAEDKKCSDEFGEKCETCECSTYPTKGTSCTGCTGLMSGVTDWFIDKRSNDGTGSPVSKPYYAKKCSDTFGSGCLECNSTSGCTKVKPDYKLTGSAPNKQAVPCASNEYCKGDGTSKSCSQNSSWGTNYQKCATCNSTTCLSAIDGYYVDDGTIRSCSNAESNYATTGFGTGCLRCDFLNGCTRTKPEYELTDCTKTRNSGKKCATSCSTDKYCPGADSGTGSPSTCSDVYGSSCSQCNSNQCTSCIANYYRSGKTCVACSEGYYSNAGATICSKCYTGCASCSGSSSTNCTSCKAGYKFSSNKCTKCATNEYCPGGTSGATSTCGEGCADCDASGVCLSCAQGFTMNNGVCEQNAGKNDDGLLTECSMEGCAKCDYAGLCYACQVGYRFRLNTNTEVSTWLGGPIEGIVQSNTTTTTLTGTCTYCGGSIGGTTSSCFSCSDSNCFRCAKPGSNQCLECQTGYNLTTNNTCIQCNDPYCTKCTNPSQCEACNTSLGLTLQSNRCKFAGTCPINGCKTCETNKKCVECNDDFELRDNGTCKYTGPELPNCIEYKSRNECSKCGTVSTTEPNVAARTDIQLAVGYDGKCYAPYLPKIPNCMYVNTTDSGGTTPMKVIYGGEGCPVDANSPQYANISGFTTTNEYARDLIGCNSFDENCLLCGYHGIVEVGFGYGCKLCKPGYKISFASLQSGKVRGISASPKRTAPRSYCLSIKNLDGTWKTTCYPDCYYEDCHADILAHCVPE